MSPRPGAYGYAETEADGGKPPNAYVPYVSAEVRVFWPPKATPEQIEETLTLAVARARYEIALKREAAAA